MAPPRPLPGCLGSVGGTLVSVLVVTSCLGTLNGLMLACTRGLYSIAARDLGPKPQIFRQVDAATNMPNNSAVVALVLCAFWMLYYFGAELAGTPWFGFFSFDSSELPIITIYGGYLPIFVFTMLRGKDMHPFRRYGVSAAAILCCLFMMLAAVVAPRHHRGGVFVPVCCCYGHRRVFRQKTARRQGSAHPQRRRLTQPLIFPSSVV